MGLLRARAGVTALGPTNRGPRRAELRGALLAGAVIAVVGCGGAGNGSGGGGSNATSSSTGGGASTSAGGAGQGGAGAGGQGGATASSGGAPATSASSGVGGVGGTGGLSATGNGQTVSANLSQSCALTTAGGVVCWGTNDSGQLGDGSMTTSDVPVAVSGLSSGIATVTAGGVHTCALTATGGVLCWGSNSDGELGDGTTNPSEVPISVPGVTSGVTSLSAGYQHVCAVTSAGAAICWGENQSGQLGDGTIVDKLSPTQVVGLDSGIAAIAAGQFHSCALTTAGGVMCWGYNGYGELGDGSETDSSVPVTVTGLPSGITSVTAGSYHTCALTTAGGVLCWGLGHDGEIGDGSNTSRKTPVVVSGLSSGVVAISAAYSHTTAFTSGGSVVSWGGNANGQLGDRSITNSNVPVPVSGLSMGAAAIAAGGYHACAVTTQGGIFCWGDNAYQELGDGSMHHETCGAFDCSVIPVQVVGF